MPVAGSGCADLAVGNTVKISCGREAQLSSQCLAEDRAASSRAKGIVKASCVAALPVARSGRRRERRGRQEELGRAGRRGGVAQYLLRNIAANNARGFPGECLV